MESQTMIAPVFRPSAARRFGAALLAMLLGALTTTARANDWPQWRCDANRSAVTDEAAPAKPALLWHLALDRPDPAYDHQYRMCADETYAPVAAGGLIFIPSNVTDQVLARDLATGEVVWQFATGGPVRFAPLCAGDTVCFGSDDGYLYGVSAREGRLRWKVHGAPDDRPDSRMLVNSRLCSRWPVRGAPVAWEGTVFFGAGVWPEEGVYVTAVDAETGKVRWRSDAMSYVANGMSDHGKAYDLGLPPQGYLAFIDGHLAVPSGRSLAAWFDPATGKMEPYTCFYVKTNPPRGTWYLAGIRQYAVQGGNWFATRSDTLPPKPPKLADATSAIFWSRKQHPNEQYVMKHRPFFNTDAVRLHPENRYTEPVLTPTTAYASEFDAEADYLVPRGHTQVAHPAFDRIVARDLTRPRWTGTETRHIRYGRRKVTVARMEFPVLWELASPLKVLIKAGDRLYAAGPNTIAAVAIPQEGEQPQVAWRAEVNGTPVHALVADATLVTVTDTGHVYAFGRGSGDAKAAPAEETKPGEPYASPPGGYTLVLGWGDGKGAEALAEDGRHKVVVLEPEAKRVAAARARLADKGLCGRQVQVVRGDLAATQLTPYWASRVVLESESALGEAPAKGLGAALDVLRPFGGDLALPANAERAAILENLLANREGYTLTRPAGRLRVRRESPPAGAADWTHEAGGPGNRFASSDRLVRWPLALLWYSGEVDRFFTPAAHFQHERHPYPLVIDGRMFIIAGQILHAVDIYTGNYLWRSEMPLTPYVRTRFFDSRQYGRPTERNCVAARDWVYAVTGPEIRAYDTDTGEEQAVFPVPPALRQEAEAATPEVKRMHYHGHADTARAAPYWTEVRLWGDTLLAVLGRTLTAVDRHSGEVCWTRPSTRDTTVYAVGEGTLYGLDCDRPPLAGEATKAEHTGLLFALDPATGTRKWEKPVTYPPVPKHQVRLPRPWLRPILPVLAYNPAHDLLVLTVNRNSLHAFRAGGGEPVWSKPLPAGGDLQRVYPPVVTDDYLLVSRYKGLFGYLFDIRTGQEAGDATGIPRPRTCARVIGNNHLLVYRDAATELYDIHTNRMVGLNSVRSGCTTSFIPAGGVMAAPMLGHGCVCNYPMFASLGLYPCPSIEEVRPKAVRKSWRNQAKDVLKPLAADPFAGRDASPADADQLHLVNATVESSGSALRFRTKDEKAGYAVRRAEKPLEKATFRFAVKRAPGTHRHGNAFFVFGPSTKPEDLVECRLYYGGRSSLMIAGNAVERVDEKIDVGKGVYEVTVTVDCRGQKVVFEAAGHTVRTAITGSLDAVTHYGYGGANADNFFTAIEVESRAVRVGSRPDAPP